MRAALSWVCLGLLSCNSAPLDYRDLGTAPGAAGSWMAPSDFCGEGMARDLPVHQQIGDFVYCTGPIPIKPVDDPIFEPCDSPDTDRLSPDDEVAWLYDGVNARAYARGPLERREGVHDLLNGIPIFVDF